MQKKHVLENLSWGQFLYAKRLTAQMLRSWSNTTQTLAFNSANTSTAKPQPVGYFYLHGLEFFGRLRVENS